MAYADARAALNMDDGRWTIFGQEEKITAEVIKMINETSEFSPITLNTSWSWIWRFCFFMAVCGTGTIVNAFYIAAFFIAEELKKKGNMFLVCLGIADLIITTAVVPTVMVVMLSGVKETIELCHALQLLTQWSTYSYSLFFMLVAIDIYTRLVSGLSYYRKCVLSCPFSTVVAFIFTISLTTAGFGIYFDLDYDYCTRQHHGDHRFRLITTIVFYIIPCLVTTCLLLHTSEITKDRVVRLIRFKRLPLHIKDKKLTCLHIVSYMLNVFAWAPYLIIVNWYPNISDSKYYASVWTGMLRSIVSGFLYAMNVNFRHPFYKVYMYCCCCTDVQPTNSHVSRSSDNNSPYRMRALVMTNLNSPRRDGACDELFVPMQ